MSASIDHSIRVYGTGYSYNFSRGMLAHTLKSRGLSLDAGYKIARKIYDLFIELKINEISELELRKYVKDIALEITGERIGEFYNLVERWHDSRIPLVILISGARGLRKSTLSRELSSRFGIQKIVSTSIITNILRKMISPELAPELHCKSYVAYKQLRPIYSILYDPILIGYEEHSRFPAEAIEALVKRGINENQSLIIQGEHLLPRFLSDELIDHPSIVYITLSISDKQRHFETYLSKYPEEEHEYREKHFESIRKIHDYLVEQARSRGHRIVEVSSFDTAVQQIQDIVVERLKKMFGKDGKLKYKFTSYNSFVINS